jgi:hypothetical protein
MLGKQWLNRFLRVDNRWSLVDKGRDRQRKLDGTRNWRLDWFMESLLILLQIALLLLGLALSMYLRTLFTQVASVVIFFTSFGVACYVVIVFFGISSYDCPYQTIASFLIRAAIHHNYKQTIRKSILYMNKEFHSKMEIFSSVKAGVTGWFRPPGRDVEQAALPEIDSRRVAIVNRGNSPIPIFTDKDMNVNDHVLDARCIAWMLETSTDVEIAIAATQLY